MSAQRSVLIDGDWVDVSEDEFWAIQDGYDPLNRPGLSDDPRVHGI
jgi:hypothetical protein